MNPQLIWTITAALIGGGIGILVGFQLKKTLTAKSVQDLETKQKEIILKAKDEALKIKEEAKKDEGEKRNYLDTVEQSLRRREELVDRRLDDLEQGRQSLQNKEREIESIKNELQKIKEKQFETLEGIAKLKKADAKKYLLEEVEKEYQEEIIVEIKKQKERLKDEAEKIARQVVATAIGRLASDQTAESTSYTINIPNEEMKGRIIGKEGRNIQHFEKVTGVDVVIDDSPETVTIACFDPVRRYIGKIALERLIADGRIQPTRIEEVVKKVEEDVNKETKEAGEQVVLEIGVTGLPSDLIKILGTLKFRTSYGQNQLRHAVEVAQIAGVLAAEVGADVNIAKKAGLLHDIGKAIDHSVSGAHHHISMDIARKYGLSETVVNAIGAHHDDIEPKTVEAILVKAADAISGARPGARRESLEQYVQRMKDLENLTNAFVGVEKSFAIQAGREVRIIVKPEEIDDLESIKLAKDITKKIEQDLQYPGQIKVNVIRETRAIEYAK